MSQPVYVTGVWVRGRLGFSRYLFQQSILEGAFPPADLVVGKTPLWRLAGLVERFPGLITDPAPSVDVAKDLDARKVARLMAKHKASSAR